MPRIKMAYTIALKINVVESDCIKTLKFDRGMLVCEAFQLIAEKLPGIHLRNSREYGLFRPIEDSARGCWLNQGMTLEHYDLQSGDILWYKKKIHPLQIRTLDDSVKTLLIDNSQTVAELTKVVCSRIGLHNPEEFSFTCDEETPEQMLQRTEHQARNQKKLESLKKKLHTDDELNWLNMDKSLCEQGIEESTVLTLRKKFFFSDKNVHSNDPVQLNLLYVQLRDTIVNGSHPCTRDECVHLAALQCQILYGNYNKSRQKPGFLELYKFLPPHYVKQKKIEKSIFAEHCKLINLNETNAKFRYIQFCRSLRTYGVTFFVVQEKLRFRGKLVPRLLGITRESIMRVDEKTREVLKTWPFSIIKGWAATPGSFALDFGEYSKSIYKVQTTEGEAISQLITGYIDLISQRKSPVHHEPSKKDEYTVTATQCASDPREAMRRNAREALEVSLTMKKAAMKQISDSEVQETRRKASLSTSCMLKVPTAHDNPQKTTVAHYARVEKKVPKCWSRDEKVEGADVHLDSTVTETGDYMKLIKTPEGFAGAASASEYQKLHLRDSPTTSDPDYDYISSLEDDYQPLMLTNVKGLSNSRDSIYQALFSSPD